MESTAAKAGPRGPDRAAAFEPPPGRGPAAGPGRAAAASARDRRTSAAGWPLHGTSPRPRASP